MSENPDFNVTVPFSLIQRLMDRGDRLEVELLQQRRFDAAVDGLEALGLLRPDASFEEFEAIIGRLEADKTQEDAVPVPETRVFSFKAGSWPTAAGWYESPDVWFAIDANKAGREVPAGEVFYCSGNPWEAWTEAYANSKGIYR